MVRGTFYILITNFHSGMLLCYWSEGYSSAYRGLVLERACDDDARLWAASVSAMARKEIKPCCMSNVLGRVWVGLENLLS